MSVRLSVAAVRDLAQADALQEFLQFLKQTRFHVFTINGFPCALFHGDRVKDGVYLPDRKAEERLGYIKRSVDASASILPETGKDNAQKLLRK